ncbi:hypothetical protein K3495_g536 [Podosphaera aphanis]|nr:hypothetical protein K3495_g536 [Podosphaera aphanis]
MAVKAINDTAGPDGIVSTLRVFGAFPRIVKGDAPTPDIMQRAKAINRVMAEVSKLRANRQIQEAINSLNGPSPRTIPLGSDVLVWRAHRKKLEGPYCYSYELTEDRILATEDVLKTHWCFDQRVLRFTLQKNNNLTENENEERHNNPQPDPVPNVIPTPITNPSTTIPSSQRQRRLPARFRDNTPNLSVFTIITTMPTDFAASRQKELDGLLSKSVFELEGSYHVPRGTRIFKSRFVDTIKLPGTPQAFKKSRLVVQAYKDEEKYSILTQSPTIQRASQRLLFSVALMRGHSIFCCDISQAYMQSKTLLSRKCFVKPSAEPNLSPNVVLKVLRPLYGISEAGNHWFKTYHDHHGSKLNLEQSSSDACLLFNQSAIVALQTDDTLFACDDEFKQKERKAIDVAQL